MACQSDQLQQSSESEGSLPTLPRAHIKYPSNVLVSAKKTPNCVENCSKIRSQLATVSALVNWISRGYLLRAVRRLTLRWKLQILSYFYSFQSFQSIFGLYMMKQYVVKLRKLFPQFYTVFFVFDVTPW